MGVRKSPAEAVALLSQLTGDSRHVFLESLPDLPSVAVRFRSLLGHQQVVDAYLLAVASARRGVLLTLDRRIASGDRSAVEVLSP